MPTTKPRHAITETESIAHALEVARRRWPGQSASTLLARLIAELLADVWATTSLTMPDACVLATAEHLRCDLATFDARLARATRDRGVTVHGAAG